MMSVVGKPGLATRTLAISATRASYRYVNAEGLKTDFHSQMVGRTIDVPHRYCARNCDGFFEAIHRTRYHQLPIREGTSFPPIPRRTRPPTVPPGEERCIACKLCEAACPA